MSIARTSLEKMIDEFIRKTYEHTLKNVCLKYQDISPTLNGNYAISSCSKVVRAHNTKERKAAQMG
jgi:hypothetical protein